jgi:D-alanyl-D-alanine dipeptidase
MTDAIHASTMPLVEVAHPAIDIRLAYATPDNLTGRCLYAEVKALLRPEAAVALYRAADEFAAQGLRITLLDVYRPAAVQRAFWALLPNSDYVADPALGSDHTRGIAVDLTLTDGSGPLDMGTGFDAPEVQSHHGRHDISAAAIRNRLLLRAVMEAAGFQALPTEWWHYALPNRADFPLIDDSIGALKVTV